VTARTSWPTVAIQPVSILAGKLPIAVIPAMITGMVMADIGDPRTWPSMLEDAIAQFRWWYLGVALGAVWALAVFVSLPPVRATLDALARRGTRARVGWKQPWVLRHSALAMVAGLSGTIAVFFAVYVRVEGDAKDAIDTAVKAASATAAVVAGIFTWGQLALSRYEHQLAIDRDLTERSTKSVALLSSPDPLTRVGAIYDLERCALDSNRSRGYAATDGWRALNLLAKFAVLASEDDSESPRTDVEDAVRVLGRFRYLSGTSMHWPHRLVGVVADGAELAGMDLAGSKLPRSSFRNADLNKSRLSRTVFSNANLTNCNASAADLKDADLGSVCADGINLRRAALNRANLSHASMKGAQLPFAVLRKANLMSAELDGARLDFVKGGSASFKQASLAGADLTQSWLTRTRLDGADMTRATMVRSVCLLSSMSQAVLLEAQLDEAWLIGASFQHADLRQTRWQRARVIVANFEGSDLRGADLRRARLWLVRLRGAKHDATTLWPHGRQPREMDEALKDLASTARNIARRLRGFKTDKSRTRDG
jgi:uncharacterized protein YjbI with pentapeptide repeats